VSELVERIGYREFNNWVKWYKLQEDKGKKGRQEKDEAVIDLDSMSADEVKAKWQQR